VEVESNVSEHALTKKVSAIAVMAAPLRTVLKTMTWPGSYKRGRRAYQKALVACPTGGRESLELAFLNWALVELVERARSSLDESVSF